MSETIEKPLAWSYSALSSFEICPRRYYRYSIAKDIVEPESEHLQFGSAVHKAFEQRVSVGKPLPLGMGMHEPLLAKLAEAPGEVYTEQKLCMNAQFQPTTWFGADAWMRSVLDYTNIRDDVATVVDFKTGKPKTDLMQLRLSAVMLFAHAPKVERVKTGLLFVAYGQAERAEFVRADIPGIWADVLPRVRKMEKARRDNEFPPKPGGLCKRWCAVTDCPFWSK